MDVGRHEKCDVSCRRRTPRHDTGATVQQHRQRSTTIDAAAAAASASAAAERRQQLRESYRDLGFVVVGGEVEAVPDGIKNRPEQVQQVRLRIQNSHQSGIRHIRDIRHHIRQYGGVRSR